MLKRMTLCMLKTEINGSDMQRQGSEQPQSTVCLVSNNAKMVPNFEGEFGGLPKDIGGESKGMPTNP